MVLAISIAGCSAAGGAGTTSPAASGETLPEPGRTVAATSVDDVTSVLASGATLSVVWVPSEPATALLAGLEEVVAQAGASIELFEAASEADVESAFASALDTQPDLLVGLGADVVDVFSFETPKQLSQQFLVLGAQLAEPTANVTAVVWDGATSRGSGASADGPLDGAPPSDRLAGDAAVAGLASISDGVTGVVVEVSASR